MFPFNRVLAKIRGCGRFSSPLRNSKDFGFYHSSNDTPSVTPLRACQLPQRGSREGFCHSTGYSLKSNVTGDFHRPYEDSGDFAVYHASCRPEIGRFRVVFIAPGAQKILAFTVQRTGQSITEKGEFVPGKYEFTFSYVMVSSFCRTSRKYSGRGAKTRTGRPSRGWRKQRAPAWRHWVSWPSSFFLWP